MRRPRAPILLAATMALGACRGPGREWPTEAEVIPEDEEEPTEFKPPPEEILAGPRGRARPEPAIAAVLDLFEAYQVVGLSDLHGCAELLAFVEALIEEPDFPARVNDITWEPGNARFQNVMDDFILRGKEVPLEELRRSWRDNTQAHTYGDTPALLGLLRTIRRVNLELPLARRVRVLLLDPPIDWRVIRSRTDVEMHDRERHMADVIENEVYARGRKALFFAGGAHVARGSGPMETLERRHPRSTFTVGLHEGFAEGSETFEARFDSWPKPALAFLPGTWLGELQPGSSGDVFIGPDGNPIAASRDTLGDRWDALLYIGKRKELTRVDPPGSDVLDAAWLEELERRRSLLGEPPRDPRPGSAQRSRRFFPDEEPVRLPLPGSPRR